MHKRTKNIHLPFPGRIVTTVGEIYTTRVFFPYIQIDYQPLIYTHANYYQLVHFFAREKKYYQLLLCVQEAHSWRQEFTAHLMPCMRRMKRKTGTQHAGRSEGQYKVRLGTS